MFNLKNCKSFIGQKKVLNEKLIFMQLCYEIDKLTFKENVFGKKGNQFSSTWHFVFISTHSTIYLKMRTACQECYRCT